MSPVGQERLPLTGLFLAGGHRVCQVSVQTFDLVMLLIFFSPQGCRAPLGSCLLLTPCEMSGAVLGAAPGAEGGSVRA